MRKLFGLSVLISVTCSCLYSQISFNEISKSPQFDKVINLDYQKEIWLSSIDINNDDVAGYANRAIEKLNLGYVAEAMSDINKAIAIDSASAQLYLLKGFCTLVLETPADALILFKKSIMLDNFNALSHYYLGEAYLSLGDHQNAMVAFKKSVRIDKDIYFGYYGLGRLFLSQYDYVHARQYLKKALRKNPGLVESIYYLALIDYFEYKYEASLHRLESINAINPAFTPGYLLSGYICLTLNKTEQAYEYWNRMVECDSTVFLSYFLRGALNIDLENYSDAISDLQHAFKLMSQIDQMLLYDYSDWTIKYRDFKMTLQLLESSDYISTSDINKAMIYKALCLVFSGQYAESLSTLKMIEENHALSIVYFIQGLNSEYLNDVESAIDFYAKSTSGENPVPFSFLKLGSLYNNLEKYFSTINTITRYFSLGENDKIAYAIRGYALMRNEKFSLALDDFSTYLEVDTTNISIFYNRGICYQETGMPHEAISDFERVLKKTPFDPGTLYHMAELKLKIRDTVSALVMLIRIIQNPNQQLGILPYKMRGNIYFELNRYDRALIDLNYILKAQPDNLEALNKRAMIYYQLLQFEDAVKDINNALVLNQDSGELYYLRALCFVKMKRFNEACSDAIKAVNLGFENDTTGLFSDCMLPR